MRLDPAARSTACPAVHTRALAWLIPAVFAYAYANTARAEGCDPDARHRVNDYRETVARARGRRTFAERKELFARWRETLPSLRRCGVELAPEWTGAEAGAPAGTSGPAAVLAGVGLYVKLDRHWETRGDAVDEDGTRVERTVRRTESLETTSTDVPRTRANAFIRAIRDQDPAGYLEYLLWNPMATRKWEDAVRDDPFVSHWMKKIDAAAGGRLTMDRATVYRLIDAYYRSSLGKKTPTAEFIFGPLEATDEPGGKARGPCAGTLTMTYRID